MSRLHSRKLPAHRGTFSYARVPMDDGGVAYRLFRRDMRRALHAELCNFHPDCDRRLIAQQLRKARHRLRETVDDIDLQILGVTQ
ncbi:hypothetical protein [Rhodanobacter hydrolyticus]|uniref:Uncharacterized protein n=1 Tax=Rhodanobacter hydrolyticus TaxID=2250595 RepID=A0ABW8J736_9GAMM